MMRVLVVDDHPAVRAGLLSLLRSEPGIVPVAAVATAADALAESERSWPDAALVDYELPDADGLQLCCDLKAQPSAPAVVLYSAYVRPRLVPAALVAGVDAMLDKGLPSEELFEVLRSVARGEADPPTAPAEVIERCVAELDPEDIPLFGMALSGTPVVEIAAVVGDEIPETRARLRDLVARLGGRRDSVSA
jgi:DNA-binding NarL/FixJ family response regulator